MRDFLPFMNNGYNINIGTPRSLKVNTTISESCEEIARIFITLK
jgi:hypothetical protein